jgi:hypothetical protein
VEEFLEKHAYLAAEFPPDSWRRRDVWSVPIRAIRELVINAVVHASYAEESAPIRVALFDDHIEVENPGELMPGVTPVTMVSGVSRLRNSAVARVFKEMNLMEQWSTGFRGAQAEQAERGLSAIEVQEFPGIARVIVPIPLHSVTIAPTPGMTRGGDGSPYGEQDAKHQVGLVEQDDRQDVKQQVGPVGHLLLRRASRSAAGRVELLRAAGLADDYRTYQRHILPLVEAGLLARTIPDKPRARTQRYRITEQGWAVLAAQVEEGQRD